MSTPLANKTTISSRNKLAQLMGDHASTTSKLRHTTTMQPPAQSGHYSRNSAASKTPAVRSSTLSSRISNGIPTSVRDGGGKSLQTTRHNNNNVAQVSSNGTNVAVGSLLPATSVKMPSRISQIASRIPPATTKIDRRSNAITGLPSTATTNARISSATSRLVGPIMSSRSPSILSSISSTNTLRQTSNLKDGRTTQSNNIPDTNSIRKGLAKFSNPMECQRQFRALNLKLSEMKDTLEARDCKINQLQEQLNGTVERGLCYALIVQYFSNMLKLDCPIDLPNECKRLKTRIADLEAKENGYRQQLDTIVNDYQSHIQVEQDLRTLIEKELLDTKQAHSKVLEDISNAHRDELNDLRDTNTAIQDELSDKVATLESDLDLKCKELSELRSNHEALTTSFNKLEESLTKDKDARVKYAQEKIGQLQKDVDSLNSVLEMKSERMHALEKDSILLVDTLSELAKQKEFSKSLSQQLESLEAALEKRKEQYEILIAEHERIREELKHERLDRRRTNVRKSGEIFSTP